MLKKIAQLSVLALLSISCSSDDNTANDTETTDQEEQLSSEKNILSFEFTINNVIYQTEVKEDSIVYSFPSNTILEGLSPKIVTSEGSSVYPRSNMPQNFNNTITYEVIAEDLSKKQYKAVFQTLDSRKSFSIQFTNLAEGQTSTSIYNGNPSDIDTLIIKVPYLSPIKELISNISIPETATVSPESGLSIDYTEPVKYTVTAEDQSEKEYLVIVDNSLKKLELPSFTGDIFRETPLGGSINFTVNEINPIIDSVNVSMLGQKTGIRYELDVLNINIDTKEVTLKLPSEYTNDYFNLEMSIEHDNFDISDIFILDKGKVYFGGVKDHFNNSTYIAKEHLFIPEEFFNTEMILDVDRLNTYSFVLRRNGLDYPMTAFDLYDGLEEIQFNMPLNDNNLLISDNNYEFVIKEQGKEDCIYDFTNIHGRTIDVLVEQEAVVSSINDGIFEVNKGDEITINGENIYFPIYNISGNIAEQYSRVKFGPREMSTKDYRDNTLYLKIPENFRSGDYAISFKNNVNRYDYKDTGVRITVSLGNSNHPSLVITNAKLYSEGDMYFPKQVLITFNESIDNIIIEKVVVYTWTLDELVINNFSSNTNTILSNSLNNEDYNNISQYNRSDGYVIVTEQGVEYKIPFHIFKQ